MNFQCFSPPLGSRGGLQLTERDKLFLEEVKQTFEFRKQQDELRKIAIDAEKVSACVCVCVLGGGGGGGWASLWLLLGLG
jgi:CRISPR/Cas system CSM-associated protein Csm5 (group 7 of RAMP superfamily)